MKVHSLESFGTVDGPGVRFIVFAQGCPLRCLYCHNPDTWDIDSPTAKEMSAEALFAEVRKYRSFIQKGGVTVSGGEPLMQADEVRRFFELCKQANIHTALDTSGVMLNDSVKALLELTDLVLLDIKSIDPKQNEIISGGAALSRTFEFLDYLQLKDKDTWIRHVVVPGYTDNDSLLKELAKRVKPYKNIKRIELLPYHTLGVNKYDALGIVYPLEGIEPLSGERIEQIKPWFE